MRQRGNEKMSKYLKPIKVVCCENCENAGNIINDYPPQAILTNNNNRVYSTIKENGYLLLDFGREISGGICITVNNVGSKEAEFDITFGESVSEALTKKLNKKCRQSSFDKELQSPGKVFVNTACR